MDKRELKRLRNKFGRFGDPVGLVALALLLVLPALAVLNLTPQTTGKDKTVLGAEDKTGIGVVLVGGIHDYIKEESLSFPSETQYKYRASLIKRDAGMYSKPVIQLINYSSESAEVSVSGTTELPTATEIAVIVNDQRFVIQRENGEPLTETLILPASSESIMYLQLDTKDVVGFNNNITLVLTSK